MFHNERMIQLISAQKVKRAMTKRSINHDLMQWHQQWNMNYQVTYNKPTPIFQILKMTAKARLVTFNLSLFLWRADCPCKVHSFGYIHVGELLLALGNLDWVLHGLVPLNSPNLWKTYSMYFSFYIFCFTRGWLFLLNSFCILPYLPLFSTTHLQSRGQLDVCNQIFWARFSSTQNNQKLALICGFLVNHGGMLFVERVCLLNGKGSLPVNYLDRQQRVSPKD